MILRFISKTHTGALRPGNFSVLINRCTYPDRTLARKTVVKRMITALGENSKSIAEFVSLLAGSNNRGFEFVRDNMTWSWKGHVINVVLTYVGKNDTNNISNLYELTQIEKVTYVRYFLETEGALILKIAELIKGREGIDYITLSGKIQSLFRSICEDYINLSYDPMARRKIKTILQEMQRQIKSRDGGYDRGTLPHKVIPHMEALKDLGLIDSSKQGDKIIYKSAISYDAPVLEKLIECLKGISNMERAFEEYGYYRIISRMFNLKPLQFDNSYDSLLCESINYCYAIVADKLTGIADIDAIVDWCCIKMLSEDNILISKDDVLQYLSKLRNKKPSSIRYHLDGKGNIAYLVLDGYIQ